MTKPAHIIKKLGRFKVSQRKRDGMFCINDFLLQWNRENPEAKVKNVNEFLKLDKTQDFMRSLYKDEKTKILVDINLVREGGTWFHPVLFIEFVSWVNPDFKAIAISLVYEQLLDIKRDAADHYKSLSSAANKLEGFNPDAGYKEVAKGLQWIVFGYEGKNLQERANESQLKERYELELKLVFAIEMHWISTFRHLLWVLRELYRQKYPERVKAKD